MDYRMGAAEMRFAELIWANAPLPSGELVRLSAELLGWKKSTTYTVLRRLCDKGLFRNEDGAVTVTVMRQVTPSVPAGMPAGKSITALPLLSTRSGCVADSSSSPVAASVSSSCASPMMGASFWLTTVAESVNRSFS